MLCGASQGVSGALAVLMKDAIKPNLMQTLEVSEIILMLIYLELNNPIKVV